MGFAKRVHKLGTGSKSRDMVALERKISFRHKSCDQKIRYGSRREALVAMRGIFEHNKATGDDRPMNVYPCKFCLGWHVGHKIERKR